MSASPPAWHSRQPTSKTAPHSSIARDPDDDDDGTAGTSAPQRADAQRRGSIELEHMRPQSPDEGLEDTRPLIAGDEDAGVRRSYSSDGDDGGEIAAGGRRRPDEGVLAQDVTPGLFIWTLTFSAGVSGLLFGYECVFAEIYVGAIY